MVSNSIMFITDYGYAVSQAEFYDIVTKYQSQDDINYYINASVPYTDHFFDPSSNIEVITLQNIVWNKSKSNQSNSNTYYIYTESILIEGEKKRLFQTNIDVSNINNHYNNFILLRKRLIETKVNIKNFLQNTNIFHRYGYFDNDNGTILVNIYYKLKDLEFAIRVETSKIKKIYKKHKNNTMVAVKLCFNNNFGLPFMLRIDEKSFIKHIESYLF